MANTGQAFVSLAATFTTDQATDQTVTGFKFTPVASTRYYVEGVFMVRSTAAGTGPRVGIAWPSGLSDAVCMVYGLGTKSGLPTYHCEGTVQASDRVCLLGGVTDTTKSYPVLLRAWFETGASPSGDFQVIFKSETGGVDVSLQAGSFLSYYTGYTGQ